MQIIYKVMAGDLVLGYIRSSHGEGTYWEEYLAREAADEKIGNGFRCSECKGKGYIYDPDDPPCPIEGNKCRDRITCQHCIKGVVDYMTFELAAKRKYQWYIDQRNKDQEKAKEDWKMLDSLEGKLTIEQWRFIKNMDRHNGSFHEYRQIKLKAPNKKRAKPAPQPSEAQAAEPKA